MLTRLCCFVFSLMVLSSCSDEPETYSFTALCYNVAGLPEGISSSNPELYSSKIGELLNEYNIVHLQEDFCYHDSILVHNTHNYMTDPSPCVPNGDGLNTFSDYPINDFERIPWDECYGTDCLTPKGFSFSTIPINNDVDIDFYNVHCNAGSSVPNLSARRNNIKQFFEYLEAKNSDNPIVVMGDFNSRYTREGDTIRAFLNNNFIDVWLELVCDNVVPPLGDSLKDCEEVGTNKNCEGVDKVFYRGSEKVNLKALSYIHGDDDRFLYNGIDSLPLSDHVPTQVVFQYSDE